ncbi:MAG: hypothetical protein IKP46_07465 [Bacteroidales bacterium]|nr:hypothetical protein [Bacteroidales bacterium]
MTRKSIIFFLGAAFLLLSCTQEQKLDFARGGGVEKQSPMPEEEAGAEAGFSVGTEEASLREVIGAGAHVFSEEDEIYLKSAIYSPKMGDDGKVYLDVPEATSGDYLMFLYPGGSRFWFSAAEDAPLKGLIIPYSQMYGTTAELLAQYPMMAASSGGGDGSLVFRELIGAVSVRVSGSGRLASVHLASRSTAGTVEDNLAGIASYTADGEYTLTEGVDFINLNCTNDGAGVEISPDGKTFYLLIAPGSYPDGLTLTLTGMDHKGQVFSVKPFEVAAGEVVSLEEEGGDSQFDYAPDEDLLFFEHFDNFVWGGNVKGNAAVSSYAPDASSNPNDNPGVRKGYEQAFTKVGTATPGSAYMQVNWATVNGWTVGERPSVSAEYVRSRNIGDLSYMFRCQEFQGCVGVGDSGSRGIYQMMKTIPIDETYYNVKLSFDACLRYNSDDELSTLLSGSGIAEKMVVDGEDILLENFLLDADDNYGNNRYTHSYNNTCTVKRKVMPGPASDKYESGWHHVEITYSHLNDLSQLRLQGSDEGGGIVNGIYLDNIELRHVPLEKAAEQPLRVLVYNLQYGMWGDQHNNFDNFVAFIKRYDPDVCVFCEAKSGWKDNAAQTVGAGSYKLFKNNNIYESDGNYMNNEWKNLAARWGHSYHAVSAYYFNDAHTNINLFPQVITSKYPVTTVKRLHNCAVPGESNVSLTRGGGHFQITAYGKTVNIVSVHLWPFKYRNNNETSKNNREGYSVQRRELSGALNETVTRTDCGDDWLIMGDMNSVSPLDEEYLTDIAYKEYVDHGDKWVETHRRVLRSPDRTDPTLNGELMFGRALFDMLREGEGSLYTGSGRFTTSTGGQVRYDMMYGSESMRRRVDSNSMVLHDSFSHTKSTPYYDPNDDEKKPKIPSDHMPILVEFDMSK